MGLIMWLMGNKMKKGIVELILVLLTLVFMGSGIEHQPDNIFQQMYQLVEYLIAAVFFSTACLVFVLG